MDREIYTPIVLNIWCRKEYQIRQFYAIKSVKPKTLILVSDGGRNKEEHGIILSNRKYIESNIDWDCHVDKLYMNSNLGMWEMLKRVEDYVWDKYDRCIYLEDDILPSMSFFFYCDELLEKYKDDTRVGVICGMNHLKSYDCGNADYFFSRQGSIWGFALWKRTYETAQINLQQISEYEKRLIISRLRKDRFVRKWMEEYLTKGKTNGHRPGPEFYFMLGVYGYNQLQIIPKKNMICCMNGILGGADSDQLDRLPRKIRSVFNMETFEIDFPLKHPNLIISDEVYEYKRNLLMAYNHPVLMFVRKVEHGINVIKSGDFKYLYKKITMWMQKDKYDK